MPSRRRLLLTLPLVAATAIAAAYGIRRYRRARTPFPHNFGDFAGPLTRPSPPYAPARPPSRPWLDPDRSAPAPTTYHTYPAAAINGQHTDYLLYLPPGYHDPAQAGRRYPVIYWLHGFEAEPQHGIAFVESLDAAIRAGHAPPAIAVLPNGLNDSWYVDAVAGHQPVERVLIDDLLPHIDLTYRTLPDRYHRALEGFSMGGWGAGHLAFKYPHLFSAVTMVCAPFHSHHTFPQFHPIFDNDPAAYYAQDPVTRARRDAATLRTQVKVRLLVGEKDLNVDFNRAFHARLTDWNFPHEFTIVPNVSLHADAMIYDGLGPKAFAFYKSVFAPAERPK